MHRGLLYFVTPAVVFFAVRPPSPDDDLVTAQRTWQWPASVSDRSLSRLRRIVHARTKGMELAMTGAVSEAAGVDVVMRTNRTAVQDTLPAPVWRCAIL